MNSKLLNEQHGRRTFAVILDSGDEVLSSLLNFVRSAQMSAARLTAIGAPQRRGPAVFRLGREAVPRHSRP